MGKSTTYTKVGPTGGSIQTTVTDEKRGDAWVWSNSKKAYVQPPKPKDGKGYIWNDNRGWVNQNLVASRFGFTARFLNDPASGDLQELFQKAWAAEKGGAEWTPDTWTAKIRETDWYKEQSESARKFATLFAVDPKEYARQRDQREETVRRAAAKVGATLEDNELREYTLKSLQLGMTDEQLSTMLSAEIDYTGKGDNKRLTGGAYESETTLREWATKNGVEVSDSWILDNVRSIAKGTISQEVAKKYITSIAKKTYSAHADMIGDDNPTLTAGNHYAQTLSTMLGIPIGSVSMNNPLMKKIMSATDEKGGALNIEAAKQMVRETDDWSKSKTGTEEINTITQGILSNFGLV
jgi:hypothetical protein